ncbi:mRNA-binding ribosome synthesis protein nop7 [Coemansia sp. RSA 2336]|nr:mRNA-binding ribosome synthesis protein nop7 [Coemansia sp. RSA 2336]
MAKIKKKYTEGASRTYITRNRALKKLQVSLADFRRLCILKGIYPVEPRNRKRANRGSTKLTTFYYARDIQLLFSEPLINKFRQHKIFLRKLQHALGKDDLTKAKTLDQNRPTISLDHLVIERYPTFADALRDLDDALCMVFLFATMPIVNGNVISRDAIAECRKLSNEFMHYVIHKQALRKVFLSIKGIYYQADIQGEKVTWIVPYQFSQRIPDEVDFRVMSTFLQFYRTLLGFVNYRLYTTANLVYPPRLDEVLEENGAGLGSLRVEAQRVEDLIAKRKEETGGQEESANARAETKEMEQRLQTLNSKIQSLVSKEEQYAPEFSSVTPLADEDEQSKGLFASQVVFLSREVPRYSLEFVIRAFGGKVGWDQSSGAGSQYRENDSAITVQISDRPTQGHQFLSRTYVQPQWVYDSINAGRLLDTSEYLVGQQLPAHLSPFVEYAEGDYVPEEAARTAALAAQGFEGEVTSLKPEDRDQPQEEDEEEGGVDGESADEDEEDDDVDAQVEKQYQQQLQAERDGIPFSKSEHAGKQKKGTQGASKRNRAEREEEERQQIAISMLSSKKRRAVNRANAEAYKHQKDTNALKARKAKLSKK